MKMQTPDLKFTVDNFKSGFLIDEELLGGISQSGEHTFTAYVVRHTTGESLGSREFSNLFEAIRMINQIERHWTFEPISRCGGNCSSGKCGKGGSCRTKIAKEEHATN